MVEVEEIELDLGLSIGGTFTRKQEQHPKPNEEEEEEDEEGKNKRQKREKTRAFHVQLLPFNNNQNGFGKVQCWEKNVLQNGEKDRKGKSYNGSSLCSSSIFSDHQGSSHEGSTESHSHSTQSLTEKTELNISKGNYITTQQPEQSASSHPLESTNADNPTQENETKVGILKPPKPVTQTSSSLPQMPYVSTTGQNGKTVNGFLYKYSKSEVSIVCVCHGSTFSPAEFVHHAGGIDISHPLKHIRVIPSPFQ
ncbi:PREDICTED: ninja-family protein AFP3-like isoform X2 [Lupinus angustifolius]|uniref:ninja-family protein AFP3-like isoform X2 n=1 Tax=Lupinus angustifolius TaxID=3871 RepID=UPI00092F4328|nr:PREDICTED: ninja-family protein AFP3-like isoform X2 [Lupinus angustifolius]